MPPRTASTSSAPIQIVCLMVGMDETAFRPIANEYRMDRDRQDSCHWDYDTVNRSLQGLLGGRGNKTGQGTEVTVTYHDVGGRLKAAADAFKSSGVFDQVADELRSNYSLREPVQFNAKRCGEANAFYDPETVEVIFCYELMQDYMELYRQSMPDEVAPAPRRPASARKRRPSSDTRGEHMLAGSTALAEPDVAAGPVVGGDDQVEHQRAQDRIDHPVERQHEEGGDEDDRVDAELEIAGADVEIVLQVQAPGC